MIDRRPIFADRRDAGRRLADALMPYAAADPLVMALPRGGAPVGYEVALALGAPLDLLFVRKIGAPGHPELGLGALVDGADPQLVMNREVEALVGPPKGYVERQVAQELKEIERRREAYVGGRAPTPVAGRTVLLIDDGVATGGTVRAALQGLRRAHVGRLVLGLPVGPADVVAALGREADEVVCLATPEPFIAVGLWYADFTQTTDAEVVDLLTRASERAPKGPPHESPAASRAAPERPR